MATFEKRSNCFLHAWFVCNSWWFVVSSQLACSRDGHTKEKKQLLLACLCCLLLMVDRRIESACLFSGWPHLRKEATASSMPDLSVTRCGLSYRVSLLFSGWPHIRKVATATSMPDPFVCHCGLSYRVSLPVLGMATLKKRRNCF